MYAGFWLRLKAFAFDYLLIFGYMMVLLIFSIFLMPSIQGWFQVSQLTAQLAGFFLLTLPISLYFIFADSRIGKQSFGKRRTAIRVVDENNRSISAVRAVFRTVLKFLPWELSHFMAYRMIYLGTEEILLVDYLVGGSVYLLIFFYISMAIFTKSKQSVYDRLTKTYVIKSNFL
ncbi:RDD family protein [Planococcus sp. CPCC 101016]|uniref:RDD family protein n=1 Tax=Planococcus sp. CPCC 101016 TaxID=2599617 RepID=UPI0011B64BE2|nr:RDD family protein [Planococcus sp. CPCC 101016]TWT08441.1 RDD family protein [Planococcus sp. CPCC 101016]